MRYVYLLEHFHAGRPTNVGVFTSLKLARTALRKLPKNYPYSIYKLPLNSILTQGRELEDQQGIFDHEHWGTNYVEYMETDVKGKIRKQGRKKELTWPSESQKSPLPKTIIPSRSMGDFDALISVARAQARAAGMRRSDIAKAVKQVRAVAFGRGVSRSTRSPYGKAGGRSKTRQAM